MRRIATTLAVVGALLFSAGAAWADAPITECDRLAAHPYDLGKITEGVDWRNLDADKAIPACQEAVNNWPTEVRLQYQLAGAFQKAGRNFGAFQIFKRLSVDPSPGYATAQNNLGNMYFRGEGVSQNYTETVNWYCKVAEQGFAIAKSWNTSTIALRIH